MPPAPNDSHGIQAVVVLVVLAASLAVTYWRTTLRLIAIAVTAFAIYGLIFVVYDLRHL
jgi:hypothetical protein